MTEFAIWDSFLQKFYPTVLTVAQGTLTVVLATVPNTALHDSHATAVAKPYYFYGSYNNF